MKTLALALKQARYADRSFWRNPAAAFFTFIFPLMFLVIFNLVFGHNKIDVPGGQVDTSTFYVPAILALSVINACYTGLSQLVANARDEGLLKRLRGTPMPPASYLAGRILHSVWLTFLLVILVVGAGGLFYDVHFPSDKLPALVLALIFGASAFCSLGLAVTGLIPNADAAPAVINATILPLLFISNVFIPTENSPHWLTDVASVFPIVHLADALHDVFSPFTTGSGIEVKHLAVLGAWCAIGIVASLRTFSWEPRK
jgi:ABC-2 type transport system permease protein